MIPRHGTLAEAGMVAAMFWIDPVHELIGAYFEVVTRMTEKMDHLWHFDLFQNVVTSAVED